MRVVDFANGVVVGLAGRSRGWVGSCCIGLPGIILRGIGHRVGIGSLSRYSTGLTEIGCSAGDEGAKELCGAAVDKAGRRYENVWLSGARGRASQSGFPRGLPANSSSGEDGYR